MEDLKRSSPTSIVDFDDNSTLSEGFTIGKLALEVGAEFQQQQDAYPTYSASPTRSRSRIKGRTLPILEEAPSNSSSGSPDHRKNVAEKLICGLNKMSKHEVIPDVVDEVGLDHEKVKKLNNAASKYALKGNEQKALRTYKRGLHMTKSEIARIQRQLIQSKDKPKYLRTTIHIVLHDEWTDVALVIAEIRTMMAIIYERTGEYNKAIHCCNEAKDVYTRQSKFDEKQQNPTTTSKESADRMAHMAMKMEGARDTYKRRRQLHEDVLTIHRNTKMTVDPAVRELLYEAVFDKTSTVLSLELESLGQNHPQVSETLAFVSKLHLEIANMEEALTAIERAVAVAEVSLGNMHPRTAEKYHEVAQMYEHIKRDEIDVANALSYYAKAVQTYQQADGDNSRLIGSILNDVGVLYIKRGQYDLAVHKLSDALASYESSVEDGRGVFADTAQVWRNLAECYILRGEWESASMAFSSALNVQRDGRKLYDAAPHDESTTPMPLLIQSESIADTLKRLGKSYAAQQKYENSFATLLEALTIVQTAYDEALKDAQSTPGHDLPEKQDQVAHITYCIAEVKQADKKYGEAVKLYDEALQLRINSDKQRPRDKKSNNVHCAMCLAGVGSVRMATKYYKMAFKAFNSAIQCTRSEKLPEFHPIVRMLWEKSRLAARKMAQGDSSKRRRKKTAQTYSDKTREEQLFFDCDCEKEVQEKLPEKLSEKPCEVAPMNSWFQTASKLEKKARFQKDNDNLEGAIETTNLILEFRRASLSKKVKAKQDSSKEKQEVARTLVGQAQLLLIQNQIKGAEKYLKEARDLYKSSGAEKGDDCIQEIQRELDRLRWQTKNAAKRTR